MTHQTKRKVNENPRPTAKETEDKQHQARKEDDKRRRLDSYAKHIQFFQLLRNDVFKDLQRRYRL